MTGDSFHMAAAFDGVDEVVLSDAEWAAQLDPGGELGLTPAAAVEAHADVTLVTADHACRARPGRIHHQEV